MRSGRRLPARLLLAWLYVAAVCALPTWLHWHAPRATEPAPKPADVLARWRAEYFAEQQGLAGVHVEQQSAHVPQDELDTDAPHAASALALVDAACAHVRRQLCAPGPGLPLSPPSPAPRRYPDPSLDEQAAVLGEHRCPPPASAAAHSSTPATPLKARCNAPGLVLATTLGALLLIAWRGRVWQPPTAASRQVAPASRPVLRHVPAASGGAARTGGAKGRGVGGCLRRLCQQRFLLPHRLPRQPGAPFPLPLQRSADLPTAHARAASARAGLGAAGRGGRRRARAAR
jgi:hypothetical protein